jgi:hypothetical protein
MLADLEALAPSVIVCAAFLVGVGWLVRRELAPRRRSREEDRQSEGAGSDQRA